MPSYCEALEAAGAEVLCFEQFGSYQGDWWAKVTYDGSTVWVHGSYGSCSGCDALESEFDYSFDHGCDKHSYNPESMCRDCQADNAKQLERLATFGRGYLGSGDFNQVEAEAHASRNFEWDSEAPAILKYLQDNAI